jgi:DNA-binding MarR family transcriptional regulator
MQDLENSFGYQLRLLHLEADRRARQALDAFGMTPARVTALLVIAAQTGCTQTALADALAINRASAMKMVNTLEALGLVSREQANDPRAHALTLTPKGRDGLDRMVAALRRADERCWPLCPQAQGELLATIRLLVAQAGRGALIPCRPLAELRQGQDPKQAQARPSIESLRNEPMPPSPSTAASPQ